MDVASEGSKSCDLVRFLGESKDLEREKSEENALIGVDGIVEELMCDETEGRGEGAARMVKSEKGRGCSCALGSDDCRAKVSESADSFSGFSSDHGAAVIA